MTDTTTDTQATLAASVDQPQADPQPATTSAADVPEDPEQAEIELKLSKDICAMPEEVKDRFKALKVLTDSLHDLDQDEDIMYRAIERKYELLYAKVYEKRAALLKGDSMPDAVDEEKFLAMKEKMVDESYETLEVPICDVG